jgi:hypothetical protein
VDVEGGICDGEEIGVDEETGLVVKVTAGKEGETDNPGETSVIIGDATQPALTIINIGRKNRPLLIPKLLLRSRKVAKIESCPVGIVRHHWDIQSENFCALCTLCLLNGRPPVVNVSFIRYVRPSIPIQIDFTFVEGRRSWGSHQFSPIACGKSASRVWIKKCSKG